MVESSSGLNSSFVQRRTVAHLCDITTSNLYEIVIARGLGFDLSIGRVYLTYGLATVLFQVLRLSVSATPPRLSFRLLLADLVFLLQKPHLLQLRVARGAGPLAQLFAHEQAHDALQLVVEGGIKFAVDCEKGFVRHLMRSK